MPSCMQVIFAPTFPQIDQSRCGCHHVSFFFFLFMTEGIAIVNWVRLEVKREEKSYCYDYCAKFIIGSCHPPPPPPHPPSV